MLYHTDHVQLKIERWEKITGMYGMKISEDKSEVVVMKRGKEMELK